MLSARAIVEFLDVPATAAWDLAPEDALAFLKAKGLRTTFNWSAMVGDEHARAFTVAKMMDADLLATVKNSLDDALAAGVPFQEWADSIVPTLQKAGWWGRKAVTAPDGSTVVAQLGSPSRLQTIYRSNMQSAYAAGQWDSIVDQASEAPYLLYDAVDDARTRPEHAAWDGTILPVTDHWWGTHYPPNGWNCRCTVIQLSAEDAADMGLTVHQQAPDDGHFTWTNPTTGEKVKVPNGIDPGWATNAGEARNKALAKALADKLAGYPQGMRAAAAKGFDAAKDAAQATLDAEVAKAQKALAKEIGQAELKRATMKAEERAAGYAIDKALSEKTQYLANAIKSIQKTKAGAGMSNTELLEAAKAQAAKAQQQAHLAHYKQAVLAGKAPGKAAQAAFDALPESAAQALQEQLTAQVQEKAAQAAAQAELDAFGAGTLEGKALAKALSSGSTEALKPTELLAKVQQDVAEAKAKQVKAQLLAGAKKKLVAGQEPTAAQAAALADLPTDDLAALFKEVDEAKAAALPPAPTAAGKGAEAVTGSAELDPDNLVQIGPQKGSNPGGLYKDTTTGDTWYIKTPQSLAHAQNEVLAAKLYQSAGVEVPELRLTTLGGKPAVASRIVDDLAKKPPAELAKAAGVREGFVVDAWLANWDVVGAGFDNLLVRNGAAVRVDTGGALLFRAQGATKGAAFGDAVTELETFLDAAKNPNTAKVFAGMSQDDLVASAKRVLAIDDDTIRALVKEYGPEGDLGDTLAKRLIARKKYLAKQFSQATEAAAKAKQLAIEDAEFAAREGLKDVDAAMLEAIKGIALRTAKGLPLEAKDFERAQRAHKALLDWTNQHGDVLTAKTMDQVSAYYQAWEQSILDAIKPGVGKVGAWKGEQFKGYTGAVTADPANVVVVLPPEGITMSPSQAKQVIADALGDTASRINVPNNGGAEVFKHVPLEHQRAIVAYTGSYYRAVNESLRAGRASKATEAYADLVNEALAVSPKYVGEVTRGITLSGDELERFLADHREALTSGRAVVHRGFISTSKGGKAAFSGNVVLHIQSRSGVWVKPISLVAKENEVLLPHGTRFMVSDLTERGGTYHVYLEEVGP